MRQGSDRDSSATSTSATRRARSQAAPRRQHRISEQPAPAKAASDQPHCRVAAQPLSATPTRRPETPGRALIRARRAGAPPPWPSPPGIIPAARPTVAAALSARRAWDWRVNVDPPPRVRSARSVHAAARPLLQAMQTARSRGRATPISPRWPPAAETARRDLGVPRCTLRVLAAPP